MKRFLALLLTLVMLVSVCGLQAFAADGDTTADTGDELVVYTRSGATRTFHVGDTFSYTYWFRLTSGSVNKITGHVLYDSECLTVNADGCKFPNMSSASTKNNAGDFEFGDSFTTSAGGVFATAAPQVMANISFTVTRGGTSGWRSASLLMISPSLSRISRIRRGRRQGIPRLTICRTKSRRRLPHR